MPHPPRMREFLPSKPYAFILLLSSLLLFLPACMLGAGGIDLHTQSLWSRAFADQFYAGELYPRWFMDMFAGAGSPAFFYNPPLPFYGVLPFRFLTSLDEWSYYPIIGGAWLAVLLSGFTMFAWLRDLRLSPEAALVGSVFYLLMPNHVAQNFYHMMLYASVWAYVPIPLMFMYARRLAVGEAGGITGYAMALGLLLLTHTISVILFGPITAAYFLAHLGKHNRMRHTLHATGAIVLGFALSAIFMIPCISYLPYISVTLDAFTLQAKEIFFFTANTQKTVPYSICWVVSALFTAALWRPAKTVQGGRFFLGLSILALVLMLPITEWVWAHVPFMNVIQMAERLFMVVALAHSWLLAALWPRWKNGAYVYALVCLIGLLASFTDRTPTVADYARQYASRAAGYEMKIEQYAATMPDRDMIKRYGTDEGREAIKANNKRVRIVEGEGNAQILQWQPRDIRILLNMQTEGTVRVRQFQFYGTAAELDGKRVELTRDETTGFLLVPVPQGEHTLRMTLQKLLPEQLGVFVSLLALAVWLILWLRQKRQAL